MTTKEYEIHREEYNPRLMMAPGYGYLSLTSQRISASWQKRLIAIEKYGWQKGEEK